MSDLIASLFFCWCIGFILRKGLRFITNLVGGQLYD